MVGKQSLYDQIREWTIGSGCKPNLNVMFFARIRIKEIQLIKDVEEISMKKK